MASPCLTLTLKHESRTTSQDEHTGLSQFLDLALAGRSSRCRALILGCLIQGEGKEKPP